MRLSRDILAEAVSVEHAVSAIITGVCFNFPLINTIKEESELNPIFAQIVSLLLSQPSCQRVGAVCFILG